MAYGEIRRASGVQFLPLDPKRVATVDCHRCERFVDFDYINVAEGQLVFAEQLWYSIDWSDSLECIRERESP